jgi:hypothetical protein
MLNKDICKKCHNNNYGIKEKIYSSIDWNENDERLWNFTMIDCIYKTGLKITDNIPKNCLYKLEHLLKEDK